MLSQRNSRGFFRVALHRAHILRRCSSDRSSMACFWLRPTRAIRGVEVGQAETARVLRFHEHLRQLLTHSASEPWPLQLYCVQAHSSCACNSVCVSKLGSLLEPPRRDGFASPPLRPHLRHDALQNILGAIAARGQQGIQRSPGLAKDFLIQSIRVCVPTPMEKVSDSLDAMASKMSSSPGHRWR